jgi:hypothetical protein
MLKARVTEEYFEYLNKKKNKLIYVVAQSCIGYHKYWPQIKCERIWPLEPDPDVAVVKLVTAHADEEDAVEGNAGEDNVAHPVFPLLGDNRQTLLQVIPSGTPRISILPCLLESYWVYTFVDIPCGFWYFLMIDILLSFDLLSGNTKAM